MKKKLVVALGGNALGNSPEEQLKLVEEMLVGLPEATKAILGQTYTLEAITYSSGLTFINKVLEKFEKATIIALSTSFDPSGK